jgi:hypothetical protein
MMENTTRQELKKRVDRLEKTLLGITCINDIQMESMGGATRVINPDHTAYLLDHFIEPAMYQVEALRVLIDSLQKMEV